MNWESNEYYKASDSDFDDAVPNEFEDDEFEVGGRASEHFAPRASVSSAGSRRRTGANQVRGTWADFVDNEPEQEGSEKFEQEEFNSGHSFDEGESSVIEEIVGEKVVELEDDEHQEEDSGDQIKKYLDVDQDDYINKDEYEHV